MASKKTRTPAIDIGITDLERKKIADGLSALLADSYTLYLMTHNFHWNVTGPQFNSLHNMFMGQYTEQWNALDVIAERIRALGFPPPAPTRNSSNWRRSRKSRAYPRPTT
jgi:starvation-inducible DNA-binding protein